MRLYLVACIIEFSGDESCCAYGKFQLVIHYIETHKDNRANYKLRRGIICVFYPLRVVWERRI